MNTIIDKSGTSERLDLLRALNAETERRRSFFGTEAEKRAYLMIRNPINFEEAFAILGVFLGMFPPAAIYLNMHFANPGSMGWLLALFVLANIVTAAAGYYLGALVGKIVRFVEKKDWVTMTVFLILIGGAWGAISGFAGGLFIFLIGSLYGAFFGILVGAAVLPVFSILHRLLNVRGFIDRRQAIPLAVGMSLIVSAYIFGL